MDFPIIVLAVLIIGVIKTVSSQPQDSEKVAEAVAIATDGGDVDEKVYADIPIGNNFELKKEFNAFTAIVKEMRLMQ